VFTKRPELVGLGGKGSDVAKRQFALGCCHSLGECEGWKVKKRNEMRLMRPLRSREAEKLENWNDVRRRSRLNTTLPISPKN
jgi:hypothetical protein